jgi:hypothetical protein
MQLPRYTHKATPIYYLIQYKKVVVPGVDKIALASNAAIWQK